MLKSFDISVVYFVKYYESNYGLLRFQQSVAGNAIMSIAYITLHAL